jgi:mannose-1-phosphate guanylyltransferase
MTNVILCGGSGTRLWPISRTLIPKQFVKFFSNKSLFQLTVERNNKLCNTQYVVSNSEQYFLAVDQLEELKTDNVKYILETIGRNTAPAIALACFDLPYNEIVLVTPSDHLIKDKKEYEKVLEKAKEFAKDNKLVTFGISPTFAETGFGYIESQNEFDVKAFHEKPDFITASLYLESGNYYWNAGIFMFKAGIYLDELKKYNLGIYNTCKIAFDNKKVDDLTSRIQYDYMEVIPAESIDCAVIEKSNIVKVIPSNISWSDVGSFDSLYEELPKDKNLNTINEKHISVNSKNNFIYGNDRIISTIDVEDLIIVDTSDALLISKKGNSQKVNQVVSQIKKTTQLHNIHLTVFRPWGTYTVLENGPGYKIKRIEVKVGGKLSLQKHFYRNEHWIVISGIATVTVGSETKILKSNESTYIKIGEIHRLENKGEIPVILIEAQVGHYTEEDDIIRFDEPIEENI